MLKYTYTRTCHSIRILPVSTVWLKTVKLMAVIRTSLGGKNNNTVLPRIILKCKTNVTIANVEFV